MKRRGGKFLQNALRVIKLPPYTIVKYVSINNGPQSSRITCTFYHHIWERAAARRLGASGKISMGAHGLLIEILVFLSFGWGPPGLLEFGGVGQSMPY